VSSQFFCPNCGESLDSQSIRSQFNCRHCGEALLLSTDNKVTLARPIQTYLSLDEHVPGNLGTSLSPDRDAPFIPQRSTQRKRKSAEIALERIANEKRDFSRGVWYGILFIVFGCIFILVSFLRQVFISSDWLNWLGFAVGLIFLPLGGYFAYWFFKSSQSLSKDEEEIGEEIIRSV
jgi:hypothetical protein